MNDTARRGRLTQARRRRQPSARFAFAAAVSLGICAAILAVLGSARFAALTQVAQAEELGGTTQHRIAAAAPSIAAPARVHPGADIRIDDFYVHIPPGAAEPLQAVVVLHGMGGVGEDFSQTIRPWTDGHGWVIVAPTFRYGDWREPTLVTHEAAEQLPRITWFLDRLPQITGLLVRPQALLYGYSRGGQTANRFALVYPDRVSGAAVVSSGTYTLPAAAFRNERDITALRFPYGVANFGELFDKTFDQEAFARIPFWIGVGARDSDPADVPHQWDPYLGDDRVERAERFAAWLQATGVNARVQVFPGVGHGENDTVRAAAMAFLAGLP